MNLGILFEVEGILQLDRVEDRLNLVQEDLLNLLVEEVQLLQVRILY